MGLPYLTPLFANVELEKAIRLKELSLEMRIPKSVLVREAIDLLLAKYDEVKARSAPAPME